MAHADPARPKVAHAFLSFSGPIYDASLDMLLGNIGHYINEGAQRITLLLSTPGGNVPNGFHLFNVLTSLPVEIETHNVGSVDSIGMIVFLAGRRRYACDNTTFMIHGVELEPSVMPLSEAIVEQRVKRIALDQERIARTLATTMNIGQKEISELMRSTVLLGPDEAKGYGLVHEVKPVEVPPGCPFLQVIPPR